MNPTLRNILALVAGWLIGSMVNMGFIMLGHQVFPIEGIDPNNMEALAEVMPTLDFKYFIFPFLAHALGTLVGCLIVSKIVTKNKMNFALGLGAFFLVGGIAAAFMIPAPTWFVVADLVLAYLPMAWIGGKLSSPKM